MLEINPNFPLGYYQRLIISTKGNKLASVAKNDTPAQFDGFFVQIL